MMGGDPAILLTALFCGLGALVLLAAAVFVAVRLARPSARVDPRAVLDGRLARGDLAVEEYHELDAALRSSRPASRRRRW